jgi:hypothetical protein
MVFLEVVLECGWQRACLFRADQNPAFGVLAIDLGFHDVEFADPAQRLSGEK